MTRCLTLEQWTDQKHFASRARVWAPKAYPFSRITRVSSPEDIRVSHFTSAEFNASVQEQNHPPREHDDASEKSESATDPDATGEVLIPPNRQRSGTLKEDPSFASLKDWLSARSPRV